MQLEYVNHLKVLCSKGMVRNILAFQRSFPNSEISLPIQELPRYVALYEKLEPTDELEKYIWLFNDSYPQFPEGYIEDRSISYEKRQADRQKIIDEKRDQGLIKILDKYGLKKVVELSNSVEVPSTLGGTLARLIEENDDVFF